MSKNLSELSGRKGVDENLFEELGIAARRNGTVSKAKMEELADKFLFGKGNIYGTVSFYDFLKEENKGKQVYVCNGSACLTAGTQEEVKEKLGSVFKAEEIGEMCCMGRCHENAAFSYKGKNYSGADIDAIHTIKEGTGKTKEKFTVDNIGTQILTAMFPGVDYYYTTLAVALRRSKEDLLQELKTSNLRGRGGAGFPIAFKMQTAKDMDSAIKFVVCNADEGDPGAYSDRYLLEEQPHSVLLGMMIAGYVIGAETGVLYIRAEYPEAIDIVQKAIDALRSKKLLGKNILGTGFNYDFKIIKAQGAYICGEETALLNSIEGKRPEVRVRPPYPAQQGLFNKPTIVNNVETLACIPYIIQNGGAKFASIGNGKSTGTKLVCLDSHFNKPGMYEVDMGTPLDIVIKKLGGGYKKKVKALHIGGPLGGLVPSNKTKDLTVDFESFSSNGFLLGHASVVGIPEEFPMIKYIEHLFEFTAHESCGKCFPCRLGSTRGKELVKKSLDGTFKIDRVLFRDLLETMETGSLCALGGGLPLPVKNALQYFDKELKPYFTK
ncbi:MAG: NAD(P)H-dependent oxidoreductase subunit E [Crocinitomicaceae bacterium]|nr:NAD(P)H-dependent oxidoreductase subunit E [Crocinitomicaceae bacterium]